MASSKKSSSLKEITTRFCKQFPDVDQAEVFCVVGDDSMFRKLVKAGKFGEAFNRFMEWKSENEDADSDSEDDDCADEKAELSELAETAKQLEHDLNRTQTAWKTPFLGGGNDALGAYITERQKNFSRKKHYAKVVPIVQSSGAGKSRLVHEYGKERVGVIYTIRRDNQGGYPPGDPEITEYLSASVIHKTSYEAVIALLGATIRVVQTEFNNTDNPDLFAKVFSERMAPDVSKKALTGKGIPLSTKISNVRSDYRISFIGQVMREADKISAKLQEQETATDDSVPHKLLSAHLITPLKALVKALKQASIGGYKNDCPVFFAFDELTTIVTPRGESNVFMALRRVLKLVTDQPLWTFTLSTRRRPLHHVAQIKSQDESIRVRSGDLERVPPFHSFLLDLGFREQLQVNRAGVMRLSLAQMTDMKFMANFGRSLWMGYAAGDTAAYELRDRVADKLLSNVYFSYESKAHAYLALSRRICLDLCKGQWEAMELEEELVSSNLRWIDCVESGTGMVKSSTPAEPLVGELLAFMFVEDFRLWRRCLETVRKELLPNGIVDRGCIGELIPRALLLLSRDYLFVRDIETIDELVPQADLMMKYALPFRVSGYVDTLFGKNISECVLTSPMTNKLKMAFDSNVTVNSVFGNSYMNFTQFIATPTLLDKDGRNFEQLMHRLMMQQSALQLHSDQAFWDLLIPVYRGDPTKDLDPSLLSPLFVQVKHSNETNMNVLDMTTDSSTTLIEKIVAGRPYIAIWLDLGTYSPNSPCIHKTVHSYRADAFGFYVRGRGNATFPALDVKLEGVLQRILDSKEKPLRNIQSAVAKMNDTLRNHAFDAYDALPELAGQSGTPPSDEPPKEQLTAEDVPPVAPAAHMVPDAAGPSIPARRRSGGFGGASSATKSSSVKRRKRSEATN